MYITNPVDVWIVSNHFIISHIILSGRDYCPRRCRKGGSVRLRMWPGITWLVLGLYFEFKFSWLLSPKSHLSKATRKSLWSLLQAAMGKAWWRGWGVLGLNHGHRAARHLLGLAKQAGDGPAQTRCVTVAGRWASQRGGGRSSEVSWPGHLTLALPASRKHRCLPLKPLSEELPRFSSPDSAHALPSRSGRWQEELWTRVFRAHVPEVFYWRLSLS